jgi:phosphoribosylformylglycinamidine synthase subunit PurS
VKVYLAKVYVTLKPLVNDPQGLTIQGALHNLGFAAVQSVRAGKYFEVKLEAGDKPEAEQAVGAMCAQLLANPVIEEYRFEVVPL